MKSVLVLGAGDFIGRGIVAGLLHGGWLPIAPRQLDPTDMPSLNVALHGVHAVINCGSSRPRRITRMITALVQAASRCAAPPLIVHISSMSVYGSMTGLIAEEVPLPARLGAYARAHAAAEQTAAAYGNSVILRPGCEYGPGADVWSGRVASWLCARRLGDLGANGDGYCNLLHIDDLVSAALRSLQQPQAVGRIFNLAVPDPPTWNEYLCMYGRALKATPIRRISGRWLIFESRVLAPPLKILGAAARIARLPAFVPPAVSPSFVRLARQEIRLNTASAERLLGWRSKPYHQGIAETAAWYSHQAPVSRVFPARS